MLDEWLHSAKQTVRRNINAVVRDVVDALRHCCTTEILLNLADCTQFMEFVDCIPLFAGVHWKIT